LWQTIVGVRENENPQRLFRFLVLCHFVLSFQVAKDGENIGALLLRTRLARCAVSLAVASCGVSAADQPNPKVTLTFI
jgi:hypothetical protein